MPLSLRMTNWNLLTSLWAPTGGSANPVLRLSTNVVNEDPLWLKAAAGGKRVEFAGEVMGRVGFGGTGTRVVEEPERTTLLNKLRTLASAVADPVQKTLIESQIDEMRNRLGMGQDLFLMDHVTGREFKKVLNDNAGSETELLLGLYQRSELLNDIARMIAADLFLGNYDRMAMNTGDYARTLGNAIPLAVEEQYNSGNWLLEGIHFLPIDNDAYAPSISHLPQTINAINNVKRPVTQEDVYRFVIEGGTLGMNEDRFAVMPADNVASVDAILGPDGQQNIAILLGAKFTKGSLDLYSSDVFRFAGTILPIVKTTIRSILDECKTPQGAAQSLNKMLLALKNVQGMNYSAFKVRGRFMELMLAVGADVDTSKTQALAYGRYRDWKEKYYELLSLDPQRAYRDFVPDTKLQSQNHVGMAFRGMKNKFASDGAKLDFEASEAAKAEIRSGEAKDKLTLRREIKDRAPLLKTQRKFVKIQVMQLSQLLQLEMAEFTQFLSDVLMQTLQSPVGLYYRKAISSKRDALSNLANGYETMINLLAPSLDHLDNKDKVLVGTPVLGRKLTALRNAITQVQQNVRLAAPPVVAPPPIVPPPVVPPPVQAPNVWRRANHH